jgi:hypothetical protein
MAKMHHKRRLRRQNKQVLKSGRKAKPTHHLRAGRTGSVHEKKRRQDAKQSRKNAKLSTEAAR